MKKSMILLAGVLIFGFLGAGTVMAFPPLPADLKMVEPDPALPKELAAFFGKWEGVGGSFYCAIGKIDKEEGILYTWSKQYNWESQKVKVENKKGKYQLWFRGRRGVNELELRGDYLDLYVGASGTMRFRRVQ
jgi:hypothetical protein